ncbi:iron dicitrate transport regulator FecR [Dissulfuribacter thermophilus]|uniref:Iron dicitrate transport regulator FecR n=1 Tax=Dissulfuribacter thermophilus TaxID=1156395 RepID=A0A1B9F5Q1_9BACT|nr:hypothetical protein [Dissulfuribacter thermophilus]OCC15164.1 iron dicitrate transport regulator FecR [Dissulfuribacter thermophilus]
MELRRAIELDPLDPTPYLYLATIFTDQYRAGEGILALQKAIDLNDNRLTTRSRFLLDQDRALKNISLAWSLAFMGLHEWAKAIGDWAVWNDPTNSSAYLFRASESVHLRQVGADTLGDVKRAHLLQPVNANTFITYTDYQELLEQPSFRGSSLVDIGTDETVKTRAFLQGGQGKMAVFVDANYFTTDGPKTETGNRGENTLIRIKYAVSRQHQFLFEGLAGHRNEEDLSILQNGYASPNHHVVHGDYWQGQIGYHWRQAPGNDLLLSLQIDGLDTNGLDESSDTIILSGFGPTSLITRSSLDFYRKGIRGEAIQFLRVNNHRLSIGGALEDLFVSEFFNHSRKFGILMVNALNSSNIKNHMREFRAYIRDIWKISQNLIIDSGISVCNMDGVWQASDGSSLERKEILPHIGISKKIGIKDTVRTAYFQEIQPHYLSGTLQPIEVAGFSRVSGVTPGTWSWFYGLGWDRIWSKKLFSRMEIFKLYRRYPNQFMPWAFSNLSWKDEQDTSFRLTLESLLNKRTSVSISFGVTKLKPKTDYERLDYDVGARLTWVHPKGWRIQGAVWYVDQKEQRHTNSAVGDNFTILSISLEKSLFDKKALFFTRLENITDQQYRYLLTEPTDATQLPWQRKLFELGVQWNF